MSRGADANTQRAQQSMILKTQKRDRTEAGRRIRKREKENIRGSSSNNEELSSAERGDCWEWQPLPSATTE